MIDMQEEVKPIYSDEEPGAIKGFVVGNRGLQLPKRRGEEYLFFDTPYGRNLFSVKNGELQNRHRLIRDDSTPAEVKEAVDYAWKEFEKDL